MRMAVTAAGLTGVFCALFAAGMHYAAPLLPAVPVVAISFLSGFLGSLFARAVMARKAAAASLAGGIVEK